MSFSLLTSDSLSFVYIIGCHVSLYFGNSANESIDLIDSSTLTVLAAFWLFICWIKSLWNDNLHIWRFSLRNMVQDHRFHLQCPDYCPRWMSMFCNEMHYCDMVSICYQYSDILIMMNPINHTTITIKRYLTMMCFIITIHSS